MLREGLSHPQPQPDHIAQAAGGIVLFEGVVTMSQTQIIQGFTVDSFELFGLVDF